jgi:hypothetical protein
MSIWEIPFPGNCSWSWRKILSLRGVVKKFIYFRVEDECSISLWFDNWHPLGPLVEFFGDRTIIDFDLRRDAQLSSIIARKEWIWPPSRSPEWIVLIQCTPISFLPDDGRNDPIMLE